MHRPVKYFEKGLTYAAGAAWAVFERLNRIRPNPSFTPRWSDKPLLKSWEKTKPTLGWPRTTDSLCPKCVPQIRQQILDGELPVDVLRNEKVGEIKAQIIERDGKILMVKDCPIHGRFEDVMSIDPEMFRHLEEAFPGRDIRAHSDETLHNHGSSTIQHGRGAVLTVDLTNRCNMMCDPCFMDANQVGFVHELSWEEIKTMLDNAISIKPRRQLSVQFSGGEPTLSPYFIDAIKYSRKVGYNSVQAATNGIEFAKSKELCRKAAEAGLRYAYLQFDGIGNAANEHRKVGNLFDVKLRAIENLVEAGVDVAPVTTIVNGINNEQVGRIIEFALDNPRIISLCSFQPVSFTGRDEDITDERRRAQRYTLSHLAHDVKNQIGISEPARDWFPISFMGAFSDWADLVHGPGSDWGQMNCGCHPNCGVGMAIMVDKHTKEAATLTSFLNVDQLAKDVQKINDAARGKFLNMDDIRELTEIAHDNGISTDYHINETPMIEQTHFKHYENNSTFLQPEDWPKVDELLDHLIEKNRQGYIMVNSKAHLEKMKLFMRGHIDPWNCRAGHNSMLIRTDGTVAPCFPMYSATYDWGTIENPKFDREQLNEMKKGCNTHCLSTTQYVLGHYYNNQTVLRWIIKQALHGMSGNTTAIAQA